MAIRFEILEGDGNPYETRGVPTSPQGFHLIGKSIQSLGWSVGGEDLNLGLSDGSALYFIAEAGERPRVVLVKPKKK